MKRASRWSILSQIFGLLFLPSPSENKTSVDSEILWAKIPFFAMLTNMLAPMDCSLTRSLLEPLLGAEQVAQILGVDVGHVHAQARSRKIPSIMVGKYRKFSPSQLKKWLERKNSV